MAKLSEALTTETAGGSGCCLHGLSAQAATSVHAPAASRERLEHEDAGRNRLPQTAVAGRTSTSTGIVALPDSSPSRASRAAPCRASLADCVESLAFRWTYDVLFTLSERSLGRCWTDRPSRVRLAVYTTAVLSPIPQCTLWPSDSPNPIVEHVQPRSPHDRSADTPNAVPRRPLYD